MATHLGVVLVGGRSSRFGRDKLREPWPGSEGGEWLVDQPIGALRRAGALRVLAAGSCDPSVARRFDEQILDALADNGPLGGIVAALERLALTPSVDAVVILAGDLSHVRAETVLALQDAASADESLDAAVAVGQADPAAPAGQVSGPNAGSPLEPCVALYRRSALPPLRAALGAPRVPSLQSLLARLAIVRVIRPAEELRNANRFEDLR